MNQAKSNSTELMMLSGFAVDDATAFVFSVRPDDWGDPKRETFVHRVRADAAEWVQTMRQPLNDCWWSRHGVVYVTTDTGEVIAFERGNATPERACARTEPVEAIIGFSGATAADDVLIACGGTSLFVRSAGRWSEHPLPDEVAELYRLHGLSPDEVYVCTDAGLYLWNGTVFAPRLGPDDEIVDVFVRCATELVAVGDGVHLWSDALGWKQLKSPFGRHSVGLCSVSDSVYIPSRSGIARLTGMTLEKVSGTPSGQLVPVGGGIVAAGRDRGMSFLTDRGWQRLQLAPPAAEQP
jgi:hypothetical protein